MGLPNWAVERQNKGRVKVFVVKAKIGRRPVGSNMPPPDTIDFYV